MLYRSWILLVLAFATQLGCQLVKKTVAPSNVRDWQPDQARVSYAEFDGDWATVYNIRNCHYLDDDVYVVDYYDKRFDLNGLQTVDFLVCPFIDMPDIAHTMLSFGFGTESGQHDQLALSVEIRKERGEEYAAWKGSARQYELMYVFADERDVIGVRVNHRGEDVYLYRAKATPEQVRGLFVDCLHRANKLAKEPEFYNTLTNNCTTNIVRHINRLNPGRVAFDYRILLPGHSDRLAYDLDLIERHGIFEETKRRAHINAAAKEFACQSDFSDCIRGRY
ncbi:MAG: DUF4105 domain-containing protein [Pirellulales bacterium]|nr:DUF4105 domain-containing protein [Pirellulales bacterium]